MKVEVLYKSHRYEEFDVSTQTASEPYHGEGTAILMDWNLYIDTEPDGKGVVLAQFWYNAADSSGSVLLDGVKVPFISERRLGRALLLVAPTELDEIVWLKKDGEKILWREGDDLINGERFFAQEQLCYSDAVTKSINKRALSVFDYLTHAHPDWGGDEVAASMGYTKDAIERIRTAELSQEEGFDDGKEEDNEDVWEEPTGNPDIS